MSPSDLSKKRDELAETVRVYGQLLSPHEQDVWTDGWDACQKALEEMADQSFPEDEAIDQYELLSRGQLGVPITALARWMHQRMWAKVQECEYVAEEKDRKVAVLEKKLTKFLDLEGKLKSRNIGLEYFIKQYDVIIENEEMRQKITQLESQVQKLEEQRDEARGSAEKFEMEKLKIDPARVSFDGHSFKLIINDESKLIKNLLEKQSQILAELGVDMGDNMDKREADELCEHLRDKVAKLESQISELEAANANCISRTLHDARVKDLETRNSELSRALGEVIAQFGGLKGVSMDKARSVLKGSGKNGPE